MSNPRDRRYWWEKLADWAFWSAWGAFGCVLWLKVTGRL